MTQLLSVPFLSPVTAMLIAPCESCICIRALLALASLSLSTEIAFSKNWRWSMNDRRSYGNKTSAPCSLCCRGGCQSAAGELFTSHSVLLLGCIEVRNMKTYIALLYIVWPRTDTNSSSVSRSKKLDEVLMALLLYLSCFFEHKSLQNKPKTVIM